MNHCVPYFEMEGDLSIPTSSGLSRHKKSTHPEDELMELLWQNGQVIMQSQNPRSLKKFPLEFPIEDAVIPARESTSRKISSSDATEEEAASQLFMQEDEMTSWLHYPLDGSFEQDFCADLLYPAPSGNYAPPGRSTQIPENHRPEVKPPAASRPPIPPVTRTELDSSGKFAKANSESRPSTWDKSTGKSTVIDSRETPAEVLGTRVLDGGRSSAPVSCGNIGRGSMNCDAAAVDGVRESVTCEPVGTSSSGASASAEALPMPPAENRKRKGRESDDNECQSEDAEFESPDAKKQVCRSTSARRARAAEVHNLSERRRRDRINEKMKALQELIPRCNKSDKASMLDEAIEYLKSLQLQVQMMSMGCSMIPMMFPGVQQYMPPMGMGMGMRMGMDMDMGLSRPMLPFPMVLAGSAVPTPPAAAHLGPRLPLPAFHRPPVPAADPSRIQATNQSDSVLNSIGTQSPNQPWVPNFTDPYHHNLTLHQMQIPPPQNQAIAQPSTSQGVEALESHQSG